MVALLLPVLLLAVSSLAFPSTRERLEARVAADTQSSSQPLQLEGGDVSALASNTTKVHNTGNWAGAIFAKPNGTIHSVTGTFIVPKPSMPQGGNASTVYSGAAWVGIDGGSCHHVILQSGVTWHVKDGQVSYSAWYEWLPKPEVPFSGISFKAGDSVTVTVKAISSMNGTATIKNNSNGQNVEHALSAPSAQHALCQANAEWIVEDYELGGGMVPFADFGTVTFTDATATLTNGNTVGVANEDPVTIDMRKKGGIDVKTTISSSGVKVVYVGKTAAD